MSNSITSRVLLTLFIISNITLCFADQESLETNFDQVEDTENKDAHKKLDLLKENRKMERTRHGRGFLSTNQVWNLFVLLMNVEINTHNSVFRRTSCAR